MIIEDKDKKYIDVTHLLNIAMAHNINITEEFFKAIVQIVYGYIIYPVSNIYCAENENIENEDIKNTNESEENTNE